MANLMQLAGDTGAQLPGADSIPVTVTNVEAPVELTGEVMVDTLGALDDSKVTDPDAASATIPALLRGTVAALGTAADEANDPTVIGLLKQIIVKLGDVETAIGS